MCGYMVQGEITYSRKLLSGSFLDYLFEVFAIIICWAVNYVDTNKIDSCDVVFSRSVKMYNKQQQHLLVYISFSL